MAQPYSSQESGFASAMRRFSTVFLVEGVILIILGLIAVAVPAVATVAITILLGWLFIISGAVGLATSIWARPVPGFWWAIVSAIVGLIVGIMLVGQPAKGAVSLTFLLIAFFIIEGVATIMYAVDHRRELQAQWGFMLASGVVTLALAALIIMGLPGTAEWALGLLVGVDMLFGGAALIAMALAARHAA